MGAGADGPTGEAAAVAAGGAGAGVGVGSAARSAAAMRSNDPATERSGVLKSGKGTSASSRPAWTRLRATSSARMRSA